MLSKALLSLVLLISSNVFAASLRLEAPWSVRVEHQVQVRAIFTNDEGQSFDITSETQFDTSDGYRSSAPGLFHVHFPTLGFGQMHSFTVYARYTNEAGEYFSAQTRIQADLTPDYISITGPSYVPSRMTAMYRAQGHYAGRTADLTSRGNWFSNYGRMTMNGQYWAPQSYPGRVLFDTLRFNFAGRSANYTVYVQ